MSKHDRINSPFTFTSALAPREVCDLLCTAIETSIGGWMGSVSAPAWDESKSTTNWWYDDEAFLLSPEFCFDVTYDGPEDEEGSFASTKTIRLEDLKKGLGVMVEHAGYSLYEIMQENHDAAGADAFMQCVVLGEMVYG